MEASFEVCSPPEKDSLLLQTDDFVDCKSSSDQQLPSSSCLGLRQEQ
jgi:hypothetical protein